jgi:hypothetical protein
MVKAKSPDYAEKSPDLKKMRRRPIPAKGLDNFRDLQILRILGGAFIRVSVD